MTAIPSAPSRQRGVTLLGSTGSIGASTLDVLARYPDRFRIVALSANTQVERLLEQCRRFQPEFVAMQDAAAAAELEERLRKDRLPVSVLSGIEGLNTVASLPSVHTVVAAIVGAAGLLPALTATRAGKRVLIANKEPLVMAGHLFLDAARASGAELLPVDSEHNAIFQCMPADFRAGDARPEVRRIFLTGSGGPFRDWPAADMAAATPEQACAHPKWVMGRKISVDSATLMNKGLELIEACRLFGVTPEQVEIVIHPQSVIHSLVEYRDGSVLAQLGNPDMRTPIAHALAWPGRIDAGVRRLDLFELARLEFERPDTERFPCLRLAYEAARAGGTAPTVLNAANEVAVRAFLDRRIGFADIPRVIEQARAQTPVGEDVQLEAILAADDAARRAAEKAVASLDRGVRQEAG